MGKLNNILDLLKSIFSKITLKDIVYFLIIILFIGALSLSVNKCINIQDQYKNNIEALNDTIHYYKNKNNELIATKKIFQTDIKTLKLLNEDLYQQIKSLKAKGDITSGTYFSGVINNPEQDTTYIVLHDTIDRGFYKEFAFNNEYRILEGNVNYTNDTIGVNINKDQVKFDYTLAIDDKNNIYIKSSNPYVQYNEISGFQIPKQKTKHFYIGPSVNLGYDPIHNKISPTIGISIGYGLFKF